MAVDIHTHEGLVTFGIKADLGALEELLKGFGDKDIKMQLSLYSPKRSLTANSYFHSLCREIGKKQGRTETYVKNNMIADYGQPELLDNGERWVMKTNLDINKLWEQENLHTKPIGAKMEDGKELYFYAIMRPSHTYTVKEMSQLIDGTVEEAKAQGIPTITDKEMERLLNAWGKRVIYSAEL